MEKSDTVFGTLVEMQYEKIKTLIPRGHMMGTVVLSVTLLRPITNGWFQSQSSHRTKAESIRSKFDYIVNKLRMDIIVILV